MQINFEKDIATVASIKIVPTILDIVCRVTGMRFAAVARLTEDRWIACSVHDDIAFGLVPGGELRVDTTICNEIRQSGEAVIIDNVSEDALYCNHHTPKTYGIQSYISMPIWLADKSFFGTLCAIDPAPHQIKTDQTISMFKVFADIIASHLGTMDLLQSTEASLEEERKTAALREQFIAVLGHDMRNPLNAISTGMQVLAKLPLEEKASGIVKIVQNSVGRMAGLIDNVMDFARGRLGGGVTLDRKANDSLEPLLQQIVAELQTGVSNKNIEIEFAVEGSVFLMRGGSASYSQT